MKAWRQLQVTYAGGISYKVWFVGSIYLDLMLTVFALQQGFVETNPLMVRFLARPWELALLKIATPLCIAWIAPPKLLLPAICFMMALNGWHLTLLLLHP